MPKMHISKSIHIDAPVAKVYAAVSDFNHWAAWSPWLIQDPGAKVTVAGDAKYYEWAGDRVGSGNMTVTAERENEWVDYDLLFLKPWKSKAKVRFELTPEGDGTKATWLMDSGLPFFLFWMKNMMMSLIGMDYERGLAMLKDYAEDGEVHSKLDFKGYSDYPGCTYIGIRTTCTKAEVGPKMEEDIGKLMGFLDDRHDLIAGPVFSIYHKWAMTKDEIVYTSGIPVKSVPDDLPAGLLSAQIPPTRVYTIAHTGPYRHLGNAWTTLYGMKQNKAFKADNKIAPFEVYVNNPGETPDLKLVTEVHFPVK